MATLLNISQIADCWSSLRTGPLDTRDQVNRKTCDLPYDSLTSTLAGRLNLYLCKRNSTHHEHRLGASVLTLVILPLAFSCESADSSNKVTEDYRNVIEPRLKHVEATIDQLNLNCTSKKFREPKNAQSILCKICRVNRQLRKQSENKTRQAIPILSLLVEEIDHSLRCWSLKKKKRESSKPSPKWKLCKVKHILATIQTYFEQYNASQSIDRSTERLHKSKEVLGLRPSNSSTVSE